MYRKFAMLLAIVTLFVLSPAQGAVPVVLVAQDDFDVDSVTLGVWDATAPAGTGWEVRDGHLHLQASRGVENAVIVSRPAVLSPTGSVIEAKVTVDSLFRFALFVTTTTAGGVNLEVSDTISVTGSGFVSGWGGIGIAPARQGATYTIRLTFLPDHVGSAEAFDASGNLLGSAELRLRFLPEEVLDVGVASWSHSWSGRPSAYRVDHVSVAPVVA